MKVHFKDINKEPYKLTLKRENIVLQLQTTRLDQHKFLCLGNIKGDFEHYCDICGKEIKLQIDEEVNVIASNGMLDQGVELENIVEFFDDYIDFDEIFTSELEAYKSDYFYCDTCK